MRKRKDPSEKLVTVGALVHPTTEAAIDKIAIENERARGWIANKLILRGLAAYVRDGLLGEPGDFPHPQNRLASRSSASTGSIDSM